MIVEGIVFRLATPTHPGDPSLEKFGIIRTEYLADSSSDALRWTCDMDEAERFATHLAAEKFAHEHGWHARVVTAAENSIPEDRRPIVPDLPPPLPASRAPKKRKKSPVNMPALPVRKSWVNEAYP